MHCTHGTAHDFMNEISGAKRKSYTLAFKLMHLLKILGTSWKGVWSKSKKQPDRLGLQSNAFALRCSMALPSIQNRLDLHNKSFVLPLTGLTWPSSPAVLVVMDTLFSVCFSV